MSTRKGDARKKGQRYQNAKAFRNDLHDKSKQAKSLNALVFGGVCARCKETIEWKVKYQKYKPLTAPKKCVLCQQKTVKRAYYTICDQCAQEQGVCAKCGRGGMDVVDSFPQSDSERASEGAEFQFLLKQMTERKKRTYLRQQARPKPTSQKREAVGANECIQLSSHRCEEGSDQEEGVQSDDREEEEGVQSDDREEEEGVQSDDREEEEGVQSDDREEEEGVQSDDREEEEGVQSDDREGEEGVQSDDREEEEGVQSDDREKEEGVQSDDREEEEGVQSDDREEEEGVQSDDREEEEGVQSDDREGEEGVQSDDREEEADVSKGSDFSESQDRLQELDTKSDPILEHSGVDSS